MKIIVSACLLTCLIALASCAYKVEPMFTTPVDVYSSHDERIPGTWALIIDNSLTAVHRDVTPLSRLCSGHHYPVLIDHSLAESMSNTLDTLFDHLVRRSAVPTRRELKQNGFSGSILVKLDKFEPRVRCETGLWHDTCEATTEITLGVIVDGLGGRLFAESVEDQATADGISGRGCEGAATAMSESITKCVNEALKSLGKRLSNSPELRQAGQSGN